MAFYLLARTISTIQLIGSSPILETTDFSHKVITMVIDARLHFYSRRLISLAKLNGWYMEEVAAVNICLSLDRQSSISLCCLLLHVLIYTERISRCRMVFRDLISRRDERPVKDVPVHIIIILIIAFLCQIYWSSSRPSSIDKYQETP